MNRLINSKYPELYIIIGLLCWILFSSQIVSGQPDVIKATRDSIEKKLSEAKGDEKFPLLIEHGFNIRNEDSLEALKIIDEGINGAVNNGDHAAVLRAYYLLIHLYNERGDSQKAFQNAIKRIEYAKNNQQFTEQGFTHTLLARLYLNQKQFDSALRHTDEAKIIFEGLNHDKGLSAVYDSYGLINVSQGNYQKANQNYYQALEYVLKTDTNYLIGVVKYHLGFSYYHTGDYDLAAMYIHRALDYWEPLTNIGLAPTWNAMEILGNIYIKLKKFELALEYHRKALEIRKIAYIGTLPDSINLSYAYSFNNIAEVYYNLKQYDSAYWYADQSLKIKLRPATLANDGEIANSYLNTAKILLQLDSLDKASSFCNTALNFYQNDHKKDGIAEIYIVMAEIKEKLGLYDKALSDLKQSLDITNQLGAKSLQMDALKKQARILSAIGRFQESNDALFKYTALNDSIFNSDMNKRVAEMSVKYETQKKELENQFLKESIASQQKTQLYLYWASGTFFAFILALIALLMLLRQNLKNKNKQLTQKEEFNNLQKEQYQKDIDFKNRELQMLIESIKGKNDMLETIRAIMLEEIKQNCNAPVETFHRTVKTIQSHMTTDQDWNLIERQIDELSSDFKKKILEKHPHITPIDFKLLTYLKLKLPQREIASLMNITEESVRKQKYRLRKKLNLNGENLEDYLNSA